MTQTPPQSLNSQMEQMQLNGQTSPRQPPQTQPQGQPARGNHYPQMNYQNVRCLDKFDVFLTLTIQHVELNLFHY